MGKIKVSKKIYEVIEEHKLNQDALYVVRFLSLYVKFNNEESVLAVKAYLNEDGYEVEKTQEELAVKKYKEKCISLNHGNIHVRGYSDAFITAMEWMNKTFNLGIDFQEK